MENKFKNKNKQSSQTPQIYSHLLSLGLNMATGMAVFSLLGYYVDKKTGDKGFWTLAGMFLGLLYCGYEVWKLVRRNESF